MWFPFSSILLVKFFLLLTTTSKICQKKWVKKRPNLFCSKKFCQKFSVQNFLQLMYNLFSHKPLATQLSDESCNILPAFHVLTGCNFTDPFYRRSKNQSFKTCA